MDFFVRPSVPWQDCLASCKSGEPFAVNACQLPRYGRRCNPGALFPAQRSGAESATSWRLGKVFDRWGDDGAGRRRIDEPWPRTDPSAVGLARAPRGERGSPVAAGIQVNFSKIVAVPTVFYNIAASRPGFLARNLPNILARHGTAISAWPPRNARLVFLAVLLGRCYEPNKVPLAPSFPVYRDTATKKSKKNDNEENRGNHQTFQTR